MTELPRTTEISTLTLSSEDMCFRCRDTGPHVRPLMLSAALTTPVAWSVSPGLVSYPEAVATMEAHVARIIAGEEPERVWLLEHPPVYTAGTSAKPGDLIDARFPVFA